LAITDDRTAERKARVKARIEQSGSLPTLPSVVAKIVEMVDDEHTTARQLGNEIGKDQVVSAKVLKLVNSGFYGFSQPISTIPHAVAMLGFDTVKSLVLSSGVLELMDRALPGLWEHSLACAKTCTIIAEEAALDAPEEVSVIGLLHDLGKVILCQTLEAEFANIQRRAERADTLFVTAELDLLGCHHGEIGAWLLAKWALPPKLIDPIADHHDFRPQRDHAQRTAAVHLADVLVRAEAFGNGGDRKIPRLHPEALEVLGFDLPRVERLMARMHREFTDIPRHHTAT
jgi:putative nucleotidyltransferase with HDIG domain